MLDSFFHITDAQQKSSLPLSILSYVLFWKWEWIYCICHTLPALMAMTGPGLAVHLPSVVWGWWHKSFFSFLKTLNCIQHILFIFKNFLFLCFWPHFTACGILAPWPEIKPIPPALEAQSLNHWTAREVPNLLSSLGLLEGVWLALFSHFLMSRLMHTAVMCSPVQL